jgi:hypothetical protein
MGCGASCATQGCVDTTDDGGLAFQDVGPPSPVPRTSSTPGDADKGKRDFLRAMRYVEPGEPRRGRCRHCASSRSAL